ncbi:MAG: methylated-DNA--[protein]-cysteine S-methyltransferase [Planctomycetaceae bacterium]|nr:methylated-DNA--[protein]-cysteine S-methyltransferase [Planctomycetaceae bacterium]
MAGEAVVELTFGHASAAAATKALRTKASAPVTVRPGRDCGLREQVAVLVRRLEAFAAGEPDSLNDILVSQGRVGSFCGRVLEQCRCIPYGETISYAALAARVGVPGAARAVGNCMAANRTPLLVPCHRVVRSDGSIGRYSAAGGSAMKRRLLAIESRNWARNR